MAIAGTITRVPGHYDRANETCLNSGASISFVVISVNWYGTSVSVPEMAARWHVPALKNIDASLCDPWSDWTPVCVTTGYLWWRTPASNHTQPNATESLGSVRVFSEYALIAGNCMSDFNMNEMQSYKYVWYKSMCKYNCYLLHKIDKRDHL